MSYEDRGDVRRVPVLTVPDSAGGRGEQAVVIDPKGLEPVYNDFLGRLLVEGAVSVSVAAVEPLRAEQNTLCSPSSDALDTYDMPSDAQQLLVASPSEIMLMGENAVLEMLEAEINQQESPEGVITTIRRYMEVVDDRIDRQISYLESILQQPLEIVARQRTILKNLSRLRQKIKERLNGQQVSAHKNLAGQMATAAVVNPQYGSVGGEAYAESGPYAVGIFMMHHNMGLAAAKGRKELLVNGLLAGLSRSAVAPDPQFQTTQEGQLSILSTRARVAAALVRLFARRSMAPDPPMAGQEPLRSSFDEIMEVDTERMLAIKAGIASAIVQVRTHLASTLQTIGRSLHERRSASYIPPALQFSFNRAALYYRLFQLRDYLEQEVASAEAEGRTDSRLTVLKAELAELSDIDAIRKQVEAAATAWRNMGYKEIS